MMIMPIALRSLSSLVAAGLMLTWASSRIAAQPSGLPPDVQRAIAKTYVSHGTQTRYLGRAGGARSRDVELLVDGKSYPTNPTVSGARVKTATPGGDVLIKEFNSFDQAKPLPKDAGAGSATTSATPSFDCAKATLVAEKVVCADPPLASLDRAVADAYSKAMANWNEATRGTQRTTQREWLATRNACVKPGAVNAVVIDCLQGIYRRRLIEIQITGGLLTAPAAVEYRCENSDDRFAAAFYNQTDPPSVALTWGNRQVVALAARSASGARYAAADVEFWEHQGEAAVKWSGTSLVCKPVK